MVLITPSIAKSPFPPLKIAAKNTKKKTVTTAPGDKNPKYAIANPKTPVMGTITKATRKRYGQPGRHPARIVQKAKIYRLARKIAATVFCGGANTRITSYNVCYTKLLRPLPAQKIPKA